MNGSRSRSEEIAVLVEAGAPNAQGELRAILENDEEPISLRLLAAGYLGRFATAAAEEVLVAHLDAPEEALRAVVSTALARVGRERALEALLQADVRRTDFRLDFAARVIAARLGRTDRRLPPLRDDVLLDLPTASRAIVLRPATGDAAALVLRSLKQDSLAVEYDEQGVYEVRCGPRLLMLALTTRLRAGGAERALRPAFAATVARLNSESGLYYPWLVVLALPGGDRATFQLAGYRLDGTMMLRGAGRFADDSATFTLRAVRRPGAVAIDVAGTQHGATLELRRARAAVVAQRKNGVTRDAR